MDAIFSCFLYFRNLYIEKNIGGKIENVDLSRNRFREAFWYKKTSCNLQNLTNTNI